MSKRNRRTVNKKRIVCYTESSDSEDFALALQSLHKKPRSVRKSSNLRKTPRRKSNASRIENLTMQVKTNLSSLTMPPSSKNNVDVTTINLDESVIADQTKKVEDKVESFFKAQNLISDDEDEGDKKVRYPPKDAKEFYELSDSDDDIKLDNSVLQPSTSHTKPKDKSSTSCTTMNRIPSICVNSGDNLIDISNSKSDELIDLVEIPSVSKDEELMDIVDKILESTDKHTEVISEKDSSWTDYKNKAEEILGNISYLLDGISKDTESKTVESEPPKPSPQSAKSTCPICLETLGGDILAMTTVCGHVFCKVCIEQVAKTVKKCPTCRKAVNQKKIHPVYL